MFVLPASFYMRDTVLVARQLLGKRFVRRIDDRIIVGYIVETEAYTSNDPACHAYKRKTKRNSALFGPVGHTYVYLCYGIHVCLNIVARDIRVSQAGGVLIRGVIELDDIDSNKQVRRINGPGNTTKSLSITLDHTYDVTDKKSDFVVYDGPSFTDEQISRTRRIGITQATDALWRFVV